MATVSLSWPRARSALSACQRQQQQHTQEPVLSQQAQPNSSYPAGPQGSKTQRVFVDD
jgi:hypothetical protein